MNELFEIKEPKIIYMKCDCKFSMRKGVKVTATQEKQPLVALQVGIDPRYFVGTCRCGKVLVHKV